MGRLKVRMMHINASRDYFIRSGAKMAFYCVGVTPMQVMGNIRTARTHEGIGLALKKIQREKYNKTMEVSEVQGNAWFNKRFRNLSPNIHLAFPVVAQQMRKTR